MNYDPHLNVMRKTLIEATDNIRRDFVELQFLQNSDNIDNEQFAQKTYNKVKTQILRRLEKARPDYDIIVENKVIKAKKNSDQKRIWIIFPLEGFGNFRHAINHFASVIALAKGNCIEMAIVYEPLEGNIYTAKVENGALLNGKKINVSNHKNIDAAILLYNIAQKKNQTIENQQLFNIISSVSKQNIKIRSYGATILDMLAIASSNAQIYIDNSKKNILSNIGELFIKEARGRISRVYYQKQKKFLLLATNSNLHQTTEKMLGKIVI